MSINKTLLTGLWAILCSTHFAGGAWLRCYTGSLEDYLVAELDKPLTPSFSSCVDPGVPTVVYTFGYRGRSAGPATTAMLQAYIRKRKRNVLLLDWEQEAQGGVLGIPLGYTFIAVPNAKKVGKDLGDFLVRLVESGVNMTDLHLIGHSLGAHVMGYAGRRARERGHVVARITGLDPARALYEGRLAVATGLERTCARFVDVVHSDAGGYGTARAAGSVDIWPNGGRDQPGCPGADYDMFSKEALCHHDRSWMYFAEAIGAPTSFPAVRADDAAAWAAGGARSAQLIYLGDLTNTRALGNYYLTTNPAPSFGKGMEGLKPPPANASTEHRSLLSYLR